jgi:hypothetical protein
MIINEILKQQLTKQGVQTVSFEEGAQKVRDFVNSEKYLALRSKYGQRPGGHYRLGVPLAPWVHRSRFANRIKLEGFNPEKRNPVLLGFSFFPDDLDVSDLEEDFQRLEKVLVFIIGAIWVPAGKEDTTLSVWEGRSVDPKWNVMVQGEAKKAGLKLPWPKKMNRQFWKARKRFAKGVRSRLLEDGVAGILTVVELEVINHRAIYIVNEK